MARSEFGGVMAAWLVSTDENGGLIVPTSPTTLAIYDAPDGSLVTDFLDENGTPVSEIIVPANDPYIPRFSGPDGLASLWVQAATGRWIPMPRFDDGTGGGGGTGDMQLEGGNTYEYPDSQSPPWFVLSRPDDGTDSNNWRNMIEFRFFDQSTSTFRHGWHINEKALLRVRGTTPTDVPVRFMAHPAQGSNVALVEHTLSDNTVKLFQQFLDLARYLVGVEAPYLVNPLGERIYWGTADPATDPAYAAHRPNVGDGWFDFNGEA